MQTATQSTPTPVPVRFPTKILGMDVTTEDVKKQVTKIGESYFDSLSLFGFREKKLLRGTLQIGHFNSLAEPDDPTFRRTLWGQFGSSVPQELRLGDMTTYLSAGQLQYQVLWFAGDWMYVLTVRRDFPFTRTLLRRLVAYSTAGA